MAWLVVDKLGESMHRFKPTRSNDITYSNEEPDTWVSLYETNWGDLVDTRISLPSGTIEKLIGRVLTWDDDPVEFK